MALEAARFQMSNDDAGYDKGLQDGWSEAVRASGGRADVPMAKSGKSGTEYRKGLDRGFTEAAEEKRRSEGGSEKKRDSSGGGSGGEPARLGSMVTPRHLGRDQTRRPHHRCENVETRVAVPCRPDSACDGVCFPSALRLHEESVTAVAAFSEGG